MFGESYLQEEISGFSCRHYAETDSTNTRLKAWAEEGARNGSIVWADAQTHGRGRKDRLWLSRQGYGLWASFLFRPSGNFSIENTPLLVFCAALAAAKAVKSLVDAEVQIKWPNDLVLNGKKICGILCEMRAHETELGWAVIGIGINVLGNDFPETLPWAGSVESATHRQISIRQLLQTLSVALSEQTSRLQQGRFGDILQEIVSLSATLGRQVIVKEDDSEVRGVARAFLPDGALLLECEDGSARVFRAGDVSVRGMMDYL